MTSTEASISIQPTSTGKFRVVLFIPPNDWFSSAPIQTYDLAKQTADILAHDIQYEVGEA